MAIFLAWTLLRELRPFVGLGRRAVGGTNRKLKKARQRVDKIDQLIKDKEFLTALKELEQAFVLSISESTAQVRSNREHNQAMLSRCLVVGENLGTRSESLPSVEKLMLERVELQLLRLKTKDAFHNIASKQESRGKQLPNWSKSEHQRKMKDIETELGRNLSELEDALASMFHSLQNSSSQGEDIIYH